MGKAFNTFLAISTAGLSIPITNAIDRSKNAAEKNQAPPAPPALPAAPTPDASQEVASEAVRKRKAALSMAGQTIYSSPLGLAGEASIARKTLLGQ